MQVCAWWKNRSRSGKPNCADSASRSRKGSTAGHQRSSTLTTLSLEAAHENEPVPRLEISPKAKRDMDGIWDYVADRNEAAADGLILRIRSALGILSEHPRLGTSRRELGPRMRSHVVRPFVIYYRPFSDGILVVRVLHQSRDSLLEA